jgi:DNA-3-methyladenine glycosylase
MAYKKLPRSFYLRPTLEVARDLLGTLLLRRLGSDILVGKIVEVEAYMGAHDPASHAFRGLTKRNEVMFGQGGHLYVYFTYGMHFCGNVVTEGEGTAHAVLLRAVEPLKGIEGMARRRRRRKKQLHFREHRGIKAPRPPATSKPLLHLCSGPARMCQAFAIGRKENGTDLCGNDIWLARDSNATTAPKVAVSTRVGVTRGARHRWRFYIKDNPFVSPGKPS